MPSAYRMKRLHLRCRKFEYGSSDIPHKQQKAAKLQGIVPHLSHELLFSLFDSQQLGCCCVVVILLFSSVPENVLSCVNFRMARVRPGKTMNMSPKGCSNPA
jgi:hypothetical protein